MEIKQLFSRYKIRISASTALATAFGAASHLAPEIPYSSRVRGMAVQAMQEQYPDGLPPDGLVYASMVFPDDRNDFPAHFIQVERKEESPGRPDCGKFRVTVIKTSDLKLFIVPISWGGKIEFCVPP